MKQRLPYAYVTKHVDEMYDKPLESKTDEAINKHCELIQDYIVACGWDIEDYIRVMMGYEDLTTMN
jgi:hypothetical protein